jgi:hypothetical protein
MDPRFTGIDKKKPRTVFSIRPILFYIYVSSVKKEKQKREKRIGSFSLSLIRLCFWF